MGAHVSVLDVKPQKLAYLYDAMQGQVTTIMSNKANIEEAVADADLVIGSVLVPGAKAPKLISKALVKRMRAGSVLLDIAIDQGGCAETSRPTSHHDPIYVDEGVVHYCVANMPGAVPHTATYALTNATLSYALTLADRGFAAAVADDPVLRRGVNVADGAVWHPGVAAAFGLPVAATD
jgi:alanine dehydrogenase